MTKLNDIRKQKRILVTFDEVISEDEPEDLIPNISSFMSLTDPSPNPIGSLLMHIRKMGHVVDTANNAVADDPGVSGIEGADQHADAGVWQSLIMASNRQTVPKLIKEDYIDYTTMVPT